MKKLLSIVLFSVLLAFATNAQTCKVWCVSTTKDKPADAKSEAKEFTLEIALDSTNVFKHSSVNGVIAFTPAELVKYKKGDVKFKFNNLKDQESYDKPVEFTKPVRVADLCGKKLVVKGRW